MCTDCTVVIVDRCFVMQHAMWHSDGIKTMLGHIYACIAAIYLHSRLHELCHTPQSTPMPDITAMCLQVMGGLQLVRVCLCVQLAAPGACLPCVQQLTWESLTDASLCMTWLR